MRIAVLLALLFAGLFSMWASTGARIMRCALALELADDVQVEGVKAPGAWLVGLLDARRERPTPYEIREIDSL